MPSFLAGEYVSTVGTWLAAAIVALFGALGGFLSGLLQVRNARVTLAEYQQRLYVKSADGTRTIGWRAGMAATLPLSLGLGYVLLGEGPLPINVIVSGE